MCTDRTKQEYIFLKAFGDSSDLVTSLEVIDSMIEDAKLLGSDYYSKGPLPLKKLFQNASEDGYIERVNPKSWKITETGKKWREFKYQKYISPSQQNARKLLLEPSV